jgi:hypothetical protein
LSEKNLGEANAQLKQTNTELREESLQMTEKYNQALSKNAMLETQIRKFNDLLESKESH